MEKMHIDKWMKRKHLHLVGKGRQAFCTITFCNALLSLSLSLVLVGRFAINAKTKHHHPSYLLQTIQIE